MAEYIDKKAADNALTAAAAADSDKKRRTWAKAIGVLHDVPAADVVPVVRGKFIELDIDDETKPSKFQCSVCLHTEELFVITPEELEWKYCPHCGADMRGEST